MKKYILMVIVCANIVVHASEKPLASYNQVVDGVNEMILNGKTTLLDDLFAYTSIDQYHKDIILEKAALTPCLHIFLKAWHAGAKCNNPKVLVRKIRKKQEQTHRAFEFEKWERFGKLVLFFENISGKTPNK